MSITESFLLGGLVEPSWYVYPAAVLIILGLAVVVWGLSWGTSAVYRQARDPNKALAIMQGFRVGIIGLSLAGIGAARLWHLDWLLALSLIIGGEEILESTVVIAALKRTPVGHPVLREVVHV